MYDKSFFALAYPLVYVFLCGFSLFAMIINLLMWADARNTHGQRKDGGSAA